uniref:Uncharacterized protein n=1 Tax=Panagrellus redivivus TaxID=6233 RepID=A0A7E4ZQ14_PANRE
MDRSSYRKTLGHECRPPNSRFGSQFALNRGFNPFCPFDCRLITGIGHLTPDRSVGLWWGKMPEGHLSHFYRFRLLQCTVIRPTYGSLLLTLWSDVVKVSAIPQSWVKDDMEKPY